MLEASGTPESLEAQLTVIGSSENIPDGHHLWVAVQRGTNDLYPVDQGKVSGAHWSRQITVRSPAGQKFSLVLLAAESAGHQRVTGWIDEWRKNSSTQPLNVDSPEWTILAVVPNLTLTQPCAKAPTSCLLQPEQVGQTPAKPFTFTGGGGSVTAAPADSCHRPERPLGYQITWDTRGQGAYGGWGLDWTQDQAAHIDVSSYSTLTVSVQGTASTGFFDIGLKDTNGTERKVPTHSYGPISAGWTEIAIPLADFTKTDDQHPNPVHLSSLAVLSVGFNETHGMGKVCLDKVAFR